MEHIITVEGLQKSFDRVHAVRGIDFYVEPGKLFAFLGPNGAGKSTTIDILCTLLTPDGGAVTVDGHTLGYEDDAIRRSIGVVFQESVLDGLLTVEENLTLRGRFYGKTGADLKQAVRQAAIAADAMEFLTRPYGKLSGGQRRRSDIARALVHTPKILFLDEPTTGLDPKTKEGVWQTVYDLQRKHGMTVFLTTHYMEEAAQADYITLIDHGEIAARGTPYDLQERYSSDSLLLKPRDNGAVRRVLERAGLSCAEKNGVLTATLRDTMDAIPLLQTLAPHIESFEVHHGSMEDVFLTITGGELHA